MANTSIFAAFERMWHHVTLAVNDARSSLQTQINNLSTVGEAIEDGGEIFNDYENNSAGGLHSHAEGSNNLAFGDYSHVEGIGNDAMGEAQHVSGKYCYPDDTKAVIVGNGKNRLVRSNAYTLDLDGNGWFAGQVTCGMDNQVLMTQNDVENCAIIFTHLQDLTENQKFFARENIGAATVQEVLNALPTWEGGSY